jgi:hypothetical protein
MTLAFALFVTVSACATSVREQAGRAEEPSQMAQLGMRDGSEFQQTILEDGKVSYAEYEQAYDATVSCMRDAGLVVVGPFAIMANRYLTYTVRDGAGVDSAMVGCEERYLDYVGAVWSEQQLPTGEEAERVLDDYIDCLQGLGLEVPKDASLQDVEDVAGAANGDTAYPCIERYSTSHFITRSP